MVRALVIVLLLTTLPLSAVLVESTASLSALSGVTLLSDNVGDYAFSPVIGATGISSSLCNNFSFQDANIYSLAIAENFDYLYLAGGLRAQAMDGYRWQDQYLSASIVYQNFGIGFTQHMDYLATGDEAGDYAFSWDAAFRAESGGYGSELRLLRMGSEDREIHLTTLNRIGREVSAAGTYVWNKTGSSSFRAATMFQLLDILQFYSSWQSNPSRIGAGLSIYINDIRLGYGIRTHEELNLTHSFDLSFKW